MQDSAVRFFSLYIGLELDETAKSPPYVKTSSSAMAPHHWLQWPVDFNFAHVGWRRTARYQLQLQALRVRFISFLRALLRYT